VEFVSDAHSWYKHLPLLPPGKPFFFFLNPLSGYDTVCRPNGDVVHEERTKTSRRFHYTWMTTRRYRKRFGYLDYATHAGMRFQLRTSEVALEYADLPEFSTVTASYHLPSEVAAQGSVELTGVIHSYTPQTFVWVLCLPRYIAIHPEDPPRRWPAETGGDSTLRKILDACDRERPRFDGSDSDTGINNVKEIEAELKALLRPEKERLQTNMTQAINRVLDLLYPHPNS